MRLGPVELDGANTVIGGEEDSVLGCCFCFFHGHRGDAGLVGGWGAGGEELRGKSRDYISPIAPIDHRGRSLW